MNVATQDYKGNCRRNGGKLKLSGGDIIKVIIVLITMIAGGVAGWVTLSMKVSAMEEVKKVTDENEKAIIIVQQDVKHIKDDVTELKEDVSDLNDLAQKIFLEVKK